MFSGKRTTISLVALALLSGQSAAYDSERAKANLASDFVECTAYFMFAGEGLRKNGRVADAQKVDQLAEMAAKISVMLSNEDVFNARVTLAIKEQKREMKGNYSNISILILKYADFCRELLENPEARLQYWLDRK